MFFYKYFYIYSIFVLIKINVTNEGHRLFQVPQFTITKINYQIMECLYSEYRPITNKQIQKGQ